MEIWSKEFDTPNRQLFERMWLNFIDDETARFMQKGIRRDYLNTVNPNEKRRYKSENGVWSTKLIHGGSWERVDLDTIASFATYSNSSYMWGSDHDMSYEISYDHFDQEFDSLDEFLEFVKDHHLYPQTGIVGRVCNSIVVAGYV